MREPDEVRPISGFDGLYSATRDGRIWSHAKGRATGVGNKWIVHPARWLKSGTHKQGYLVVRMRKRGRSYLMLVHRCVALAWVANPSGHSFINHLNGIKDDNRAENLEWCDHSRNLRHAYDLGLRTTTEHQRAAARKVGLANGGKTKGERNARV